MLSDGHFMVTIKEDMGMVKNWTTSFLKGLYCFQHRSTFTYTTFHSRALRNLNTLTIRPMPTKAEVGTNWNSPLLFSWIPWVDTYKTGVYSLASWKPKSRAFICTILKQLKSYRSPSAVAFWAVTLARNTLEWHWKGHLHIKNSYAEYVQRLSRETVLSGNSWQHLAVQQLNNYAPPLWSWYTLLLNTAPRVAKRSLLQKAGYTNLMMRMISRTEKSIPIQWLPVV